MTEEQLTQQLAEAVAAVNAAIAQAGSLGMSVYGSLKMSPLPAPIFGDVVRYATVSQLELRAIPDQTETGAIT